VVERVSTRLLAFCGMMLVLLVLLAGMTPDGGLAEGPGMSRKHHPWGRFTPGAWKLVRVDTYEGDATAVTSSTETKTTLQSLAEDGVSLLIEVVVEVGGKQFETQPQVVKQGFDGELCTPGAVVKNLGAGQVTIQGRKINCQIERIEIAAADSRTATKIYYSDAVEPYVLRRESTKADLQGKTLSQTTVDVTALDVLQDVLTDKHGRVDRRRASSVKAVLTTSKGTTTTLAMTCADLPGGVFRNTIDELDNQGHRIRHSVLTLVDYGLSPGDNHVDPVRYRRPGRFRGKAYRLSAH
jgi:hypothetical protein